MIEKVKNFYKTKRILFFVVIFVWLILTILLGILIGLYSNSKVIYLSHEEENARAVANMEEDEEKIIKGEMLSTKGNLDIEQMEYSKNYIKNKKNK
ncbi:hypothetical protein EPJ80_01915 [Brachyspira aalborgi]|uniref:Uncharacterized protein n=1 Tax=Brachyspira aalborgi TaxID=29522 RepID=A0A5C8CKD6_9SPIR|nr:hypothetical protein EPJ80_01915 [Brachyspira aalborgi]